MDTGDFLSCILCRMFNRRGSVFMQAAQVSEPV